MADWDLAINATRFATSVVLSLIVGIFASTFLALVADVNGYHPELVFNASGLFITLYTVAWMWKRPKTA